MQEALNPLIQPQLASLSLTHVYYDPAHILGLPSAFLALVPQALVIVYVAVIYCRRDVEVCYAFAGQMSCEALNWVLKRLFQQDRPQRMSCFVALEDFILKRQGSWS